MKSTFELNNRMNLEIKTRGSLGQSGYVGFSVRRKAGSSLSGGSCGGTRIPAPSHPTDRALTFYGPMECECGRSIVKLAEANGGYAYEQTEMLFYPNTQPKWELHECLGSATVHVLGHDWKPSEARAVASALLSAATEAKQ